jgi:hypothetical protein
MGRILKAGSRVRVGFLLRTEYFTIDYDNVIIPDLTGCLFDTGQFESVEIFIEKGGVFQRDSMIVVAITAADFNDFEDYGSLVAQEIGLCAPDLIISERKPVIIDGEPDATKNDPNVAHVNATDSGRPDKQDKCKDLAFFDYLACESGISKSGLGIGLPVLLIGGLALILVLRR